MKNRIWFIGVSLSFLVSCQSSRFMQDDMYFTSVDAKREVREYEIAKANHAKKTEELIKSEFKVNEDEIVISNSYYSDVDFTYDDYYDYSYAARIRRFHNPNNTWGYYDPYFTNYYWFNQSTISYFGNSIYSTYNWWGPNFGNNYDINYWGSNFYGFGSWGSGWYNPWVNDINSNGWWNPYNPFAYNGWNNPWYNNNSSWGNGICYNNMYYNSLDNNCYWSWWRQEDVPISNNPTNFVAIMQSNGISRDVVKRPQINYTAIREAYVVNQADIERNNGANEIHLIIENQNEQLNSNKNNSNTIVVTNNYDNNNTTIIKSNSTDKNNNGSNTYKRWDNYNADVNIAPNKTENTNMSRSGVFSEGSRNNNYEYKGSTLPNTNKVNNSNGGTENKGKDPKKR